MRFSSAIASFALLILFVSGCSNQNALLDRPKIDTTLPKPTNIRTLSDRNSIAFEWENVNDPKVEGYKVYRSSNNGSDLVATLKDRFTTHYADGGLKPDTTYSYRFSSYTKDDIESDASAVVTSKTKPLLEPVSFIAAVDNLPNRAKIIWRPHVSVDVISYEVQKSGASDKNWEDVATVAPRLMAEYIDSKVESGKTYYYRVIAKTYDGAYSMPSEVVKVMTKNLPLPATELFATKNLPKQIAVNWSAPEQKEFSKYNLYRADKPDSSYALVYMGVDTKFLDKIDKDGEVKYYKVAVVDKDGLESPFTAATGVTKPKPATPVFTLATIRENKAVLSWTTNDKETIAFKITKKWGNFLNRQEVSFTDIKGTNFEDKDVQLGTKYEYYIEAVDKDGLLSLPSDSVELFVPKGL